MAGQGKASIIILSIYSILYPTGIAHKQFTIAQPKSTPCPTPAIVLNI